MEKRKIKSKFKVSAESLLNNMKLMNYMTAKTTKDKQMMKKKGLKYFPNTALEEACKPSVRAATEIGFNRVRKRSFGGPLLIITILEEKNRFTKSSMRLLYGY